MALKAWTVEICKDSYDRAVITRLNFLLGHLSASPVFTGNSFLF